MILRTLTNRLLKMDENTVCLPDPAAAYESAERSNASTLNAVKEAASPSA